MTTQDSTKISQDQADYDAAALALAVKLREFVYKHGTKHGHGAVDALAALCDSEEQGRRYYTAALDALPVHVAAAFRGGSYMPVLSVTNPSYPTAPQRDADAAALAAEALAFCGVAGAAEDRVETFMAYVLEGPDAGWRVDAERSRPAPETLNVLAVARALRQPGESRPASVLFTLAEYNKLGAPSGDHFWFSAKMDDHYHQERARGRQVFYNYALIGDQVVRYTAMSNVNDASGYEWDDMRYLGQGAIYCASMTPLDLRNINAERAARAKDTTA